MSSHQLPQARRLAALALAGLALAGCASGPTRPAAPIYTGRERPEPTRPPRPGPPSEAPLATAEARRNAYMPRHVEVASPADLKRVAVLLPFSSSDPEVKRLSQALFNAAQIALFDSGARDVLLLPKDTGADVASASVAAEEAVREGALAIIGPLFAQHIPRVAAEAAETGAPVVSFSTDTGAVGQGAYLMSLPPSEEVARIVGWAADEGVTRFAMLGPNSPYGRAVEAALREEAGRRGALVISVEYYQPGDSSPIAPARRLADVIRAENSAAPGEVAVLIPERGVQLRSVAPLLPYFDVNVHQVKFLGTGAWNDPEVWREPSLYGGAFPAPDPASLAGFEERYRGVYGEAAPRLSSFGYDAGALVAALARSGQLSRATLERPEGFVGVNGLFRFLADGDIERGLAVMALSQQGEARVISPARSAFTPGS
jgi:ABC-type branched-subunit amino acid transport system substrate-binding protein